MNSRISLTLAIVAAALLTSSAPGQFTPRPTTGVQNPLLAGPALNTPVSPTSTSLATHSNPYAPVTSSTGSYGNAMMPNPYSPVNPSNQWGWNNQWGWGFPDPIGSYYYGNAALLNAAGQTLISQEQARLGREVAHAAWLENEKRRFDLERYIRDNTPTFTDEQLKFARVRLRRIQSNSNINEITSGTALNVLLDDIKQYRARISTLDPIPFSMDILQRLNVSGNSGNMGLLRDGGRFTWPQALRQIVPEEKLKNIDLQTQVLMQQAIAGGKVDQNVLEDLRVALDDIKEKLMAKANAVPTSQYLEAKRFLTAFDGARRGLQDGDARPYFKYQNFVRNDRSLQQVIEFMLSEGLRFAPAVPGDESAYRAVYDALAAVDVAFNAGSTNP